MTTQSGPGEPACAILTSRPPRSSACSTSASCEIESSRPSVYAWAEPMKNAITSATLTLTAIRGLNMRCLPASLHVADFGHLHHRLGGEERFVDRTHIDVPALAFGSFEPGQITHRGARGLHVGGRNAYDVFALERIDCGPSVRGTTGAAGTGAQGGG